MNSKPWILDVIYRQLAVFINIEITILTPITLKKFDHTRRTAPDFHEGQGDLALARLAALFSFVGLNGINVDIRRYQKESRKTFAS